MNTQEFHEHIRHYRAENHSDRTSVKALRVAVSEHPSQTCAATAMLWLNATKKSIQKLIAFVDGIEKREKARDVKAATVDKKTKGSADPFSVVLKTKEKSKSDAGEVHVRPDGQRTSVPLPSDLKD